ncbi:integration host factor subunit beta [bacterium]|nr:integration host factor subunit beta [candidate division CSSED10-310 bacterium]
MTKSEFIARLAQNHENLNLKEAAVVVNTFFDSIIEALTSGDKVELRGFGSFKVKQRNARIGRNPKSGTKVKVGAKKVPYFKPGKELKAIVDTP